MIFVFENDKALSTILAGRVQHKLMPPQRLGRRAYSGAVEVAPGLWVCQITKNDLALQLTL